MVQVIPIEAGLTIHLRLEELDEGLCERLDPLVHDVVTLLGRVLVVQEGDIFLLGANTDRLR